MQRKGPRNEAKEQFWREMVALQKESGLSQSAFCREKGLSANSFSFWKKRIVRLDEEKRKGQMAKNERQRAYKKRKREREQLFVQVTPTPEHVAAPPPAPPDVIAEITFAGGAVRVIAGADAKTLRALIQALKED